MQTRLERRTALLDRRAQMSSRPPRVLTTALVLAIAAVQGELPADAPMRAVETKQVERRGVNMVLASEAALGRIPTEQPFNNKGFDILSEIPDGDLIRIEVKARLVGAEDFFITHNDVMTSKNAAPRYRLALVAAHPDGPDRDEVRYLADPFASVELGDAHATGLRVAWAKTWAKGTAPF